jgi:hypothetical protein
MSTDFDDLIDPTRPIPAPAAPIPTTSSSPGPAAAAPAWEQAPGTAADAPAHVRFDLRDLQAAGDDVSNAAIALAGQLGQVTGVWLAAESLAEVLDLFAQQVDTASARDIAFKIANVPVPSKIGGDTATAVLKFRTDITNSIIARAGL